MTSIPTVAAFWRIFLPFDRVAWRSKAVNELTVVRTAQSSKAVGHPRAAHPKTLSRKNNLARSPIISIT